MSTQFVQTEVYVDTLLLTLDKTLMNQNVINTVWTKRPTSGSKFKHFDYNLQ